MILSSYLKAKHEVEDVLEKHDNPAPYRIKKKHVDHVKALKKALRILRGHISRQMEESL
jgi:hypothetical protein